MWLHLGFKLQGETTGRSKERKKLSIWRLDHGYPDLFSSGGQPGPLKVMVDLNVFADIESSYERDESMQSPGRWLETGWLIRSNSSYQRGCVVKSRTILMMRKEIGNYGCKQFRP